MPALWVFRRLSKADSRRHGDGRVVVRGAAAPVDPDYELYRAARAGVGSDGTHRAYALYHDTPVFEPLVHLFEFCFRQTTATSKVVRFRVTRWIPRIAWLGLSSTSRT